MPRRTIAFVEDDPEYIPTFVTEGFAVRPFRTYADARARLSEITACDLAIVDLGLIPGDRALEGELYLGVRLIREIRDRSAQIPIIAFTQYGTEPDVATGYADVPNVVTVTKFLEPAARLREEIVRLIGEPEGPSGSSASADGGGGRPA